MDSEQDGPNQGVPKRALERNARGDRNSITNSSSSSSHNPQLLSALVKQVHLLTHSVEEIQEQLKKGRTERKALARFAVKVSRSTSNLSAAHAKAASSRGDVRLRSRAQQASDEVQNALLELVYDITGVPDCPDLEVAALQVAFKRRPWTELPQFMMTNVLSFLPPNELLQHRRVSKAFQRVIQATMASFQPTEALVNSLEQMHTLSRQWSFEAFVPPLSAHFYSPYTLPLVLARLRTVVQSSPQEELVHATRTQRLLFRIIAECTRTTTTTTGAQNGIANDSSIHDTTSITGSAAPGADSLRQSVSHTVIALRACHCLVPLVSAVATTSMYDQPIAEHGHCLLTVVALLLRLLSAAARGQKPGVLEPDLSGSRWWCSSAGSCRGGGGAFSWVSAAVPAVELFQLVLIRRDDAAVHFRFAGYFPALRRLRDTLQKLLLQQRHSGVHIVLLARIVNYALQCTAGVPDHPAAERASLLLNEQWVPARILEQWKKVVWTVPIGELSRGVISWERVKWSSFDSTLSTITPIDFASNCAGARAPQEPPERAMFQLPEQAGRSLTTDGCLITEDEASSWVLLDFGAEARIVLHAVAFDSVGRAMTNATESNTEAAPPDDPVQPSDSAGRRVDWQWPTREYVVEVSEGGQEWDVVLSRPTVQTAESTPRREPEDARPRLETNDAELHQGGGAAHFPTGKEKHQQQQQQQQVQESGNFVDAPLPTTTIQVVGGGTSATTLARYVRLRQTGPNALGSNRLYVRFFRVYGAFYWAQERQTRFP